MKTERRINIKKMCWYTVKQWRVLLITALICSLIFTIFQYKRDYQNAVAARASQKNVSVVEIRDSLSEFQLSQIEQVYLYQNMFEGINDYVQNSVLMRISCDSEEKATLQYAISTGQGIDTLALVAAYDSYVTTGELAEDVAEKMEDGLGKYLVEIITVPSSNSSTAVLYSDERFADNIFSMNIVHYDREELQKIVETIEETLSEYSEELATKLGEHQLQLQVKSFGTHTNYALIGLQREMFKQRDETAQEYQTRLDNLSANQRQVLENWEALENGEVIENLDAGVQVEQTEIKVSLNYRAMILGFVSGVFIAIFLVMAWFISSAKIRGTEDFEALNIQLLGEQQDDNSRKRLFGIVDHLILKLQYVNKRKYTDEEIVKMLYSNILLKCQNSQVKEIYLTGTASKEAAWVKVLQRMLKDKEISLEIGDDITCNADAMLRASELNNVIFVEKENVSMFETVEEEIKTCRNNGLNLLGAILIQA